MIDENRELTDQQGELFLARFLEVYCSQNSWTDKGNALRTVFDELLNTLCRNRNLIGKSSQYQVRIEMLYGKESLDGSRLSEVSRIFSYMHHNLGVSLSKGDFDKCFRILCEFVAEKSGAIYPPELALILKPLGHVLEMRPQPIVILRELYDGPDHIEYGDRFIKAFVQEIKTKNNLGFKDVRFDLISYANPIMCLSTEELEQGKLSSKKRRVSDWSSVTTIHKWTTRGATEMHKQIVTNAINAVLDQIHNRHWEYFNDNRSLYPFFIWIFYSLPFHKNDEIVKKINDTIEDCNVSFYPIMIPTAKNHNHQEMKDKVRSLFPLCREVNFLNQPGLPGNLIKTIFYLIQETNKRN